MRQKKQKDMKVGFAASSGGHLEQLMMLKPLMEKYNGFIVTEHTDYTSTPENIKSYFFHQVNRKELFLIPKLVLNSVKSLYIIFAEKPDIIICTGVLAMVPLCLLVKLSGGRLVYVESFAKISSPTKSGKFLYKFADRFYVQWESMKEIYPNAIYLGSIY